MNQSLGWLREAEDYGHLQITQTRFRLRDEFHPPDEFDPRSWMRIRDQRPLCASCGYALATCLELIDWIAHGGRRIRLSRTFAYAMAQKMEGSLGRDRGATISGALKAAKVFG